MRRFDPAREVSEEDMRTLVEAASKAGTGGNRQTTRWLVVRDPELKERIAEYYRDGARDSLAHHIETAKTDPSVARLLRSAWHLANHLGEAPALVLACAPDDRGHAGASVFPGVQNLMLAARALGLGTTLTTIHRFHEAEIKVLLGIPPDVKIFALIPVGYPLGRWGEGPRRPPEEIAYRDRWGEPGL